MKSTIITVIITILTITAIGLAAKLYMANNQAPATSKPEAASAPTVTELPKILTVTAKYITHPIKYTKCSSEEETAMMTNQKDGTKGGVIGGVAGGVTGAVIGNQISQNNGSLIGGAIGAVTGAVAGNQIQKAQQPDRVAQTTEINKCTTKTRLVKKLAGYDVTYTYQGNTGSTFLKDKPVGNYLPLDAIK